MSKTDRFTLSNKKLDKCPHSYNTMTSGELPMVVYFVSRKKLHSVITLYITVKCTEILFWKIIAVQHFLKQKLFVA